MKKILLIVLIGILCTVMLSSCYNTRILAGNVEPKDPLIEINKEWNHGFLFGLIPLDNATMRVKDYVGNRDNYAVKTNLGFVHGLVSCITFGIYTPTQTTYYMPADER